MTTPNGARARLEAYRNSSRELDLQTNRLEQKRKEVGDVGSPGFEALPPTMSASDPIARKVMEITQLEERIETLRLEVVDEHAALERLIQRVTNAEQRMVLRMRYFDDMSWPDITFVYFGDRIDYLTEEYNYKKRLYDIHTRALVSLARVVKRSITQGSVSAN